jgi:diguanylate cyclase (GGDEF)-like protein
MAQFLTGRSVVFRLWVAVSGLLLALALIATLAYVWTSVQADIRSARHEVAVKQQTVDVFNSMVTRIGGPAAAFQFTDDDFTLMRTLGVLEIDAIDPFGNSYFHVDTATETVLQNQQYATLLVAALAGVPVDLAAASSPLQGTDSSDPAIVARVRDGERQSFALRIRATGDGQRFEVAGSSLSPLDVLRGGTFGEEVWQAGGPGGAQRLRVAYDDLAGAARQTALVAFAGMLAVYALTCAGLWFLLTGMVLRPLHRYSELAVRIAAGDGVRMPDRGDDEIGNLARAINGMADVLESKAAIDSLTGLYNLRHLSDHLDQMIFEARESQQQLSVMVADLDRFKPVNDLYGHAAGDAVLRAVGTALRNWAGDKFTCWRQGGDEFVIALPDRGPAEAAKCAMDLEDLFSNLKVRLSPSIEVNVSISVGVACLGEDGESTGALIGVADRRMYARKTLKHLGRGSAALSA